MIKPIELTDECIGFDVFMPIRRRMPDLRGRVAGRRDYDHVRVCSDNGIVESLEAVGNIGRLARTEEILVANFDVVDFPRSGIFSLSAFFLRSWLCKGGNKHPRDARKAPYVVVVSPMMNSSSLSVSWTYGPKLASVITSGGVM